ncbi:1-acyl-sn-glycerol-3-phosphate acyltransferase [Falsigemmobacter faecalis]|uniref:1-acyl-sn-glycerol-3-phosphate acyltransferase n=1 Tax=Falsigemmobacter faecalis TaxID=2488730 RepID=A0A3P3DIB2_9RHOB|nr:1-acyl-sn-glycerol-3-phosphate acyltransferase [Falsigemmobacter faecalis]
MRLALQYVLSFLFIIQMYVMMTVIALGFFPWAAFSRRGAMMACHAFCGWVRFSARWMVGLRTEIRGTPPTGPVLVASKHQSFLDIILLFSALPHPRFVMKRELLFTPVLGQYAMRIGCIPVNRDKGMTALREMLKAAKTGPHANGQLIIFAQGTRVAPGVKEPYKIGVGALYQSLKRECFPVAVNVGVFWPRRGILRKPGLAVLEFVPPIAPGLKVAPFMEVLEEVIEARSETLLDEALDQFPEKARGARV